MHIKNFKRHLSLMLCLSTMLLTSCGSLPEEFPGIDQSPEVIEMGDRFKVNFFFQNNENTYCINQNGGESHNFFEALSETISIMQYSELSKTYTLGYDDTEKKYNICEYDRTKYDNLIWEDAKKEYSSSGKKSNAKDSFYITGNSYDIPMQSRVDGGMLGLYVDEVKKAGITDASEKREETGEKSFFDPDALNIMFTDLSEKNITYLGKELYTYYTSDNRYNACVMALKLEVDNNGNNKIYFASKDNESSLTPSSPANSRWYYLVMLGPANDLAVFVQSLVTHLESMNIKANDGYRLSDLSFTPENFDAENDIEVKNLAIDDADQQRYFNSGDTNSIFESALVRLEKVEDKDSVFPVGILRDEIIEYKYKKSENVYKLKGYKNSNTKDFALNINLTKEVSNRDLIADSTNLSYVFGDPVIYYQKENEWEVMDPDHKERFFKRISVEENDGKTLTIISDNSDECGIHDVYITVPILQCAEKNQVLKSDKDSTTSWVLNDCTFKSSDTSVEAIKTYYFDKFYINLFDMEIEGSRDEYNNEYDEFRKIYSQIGEMKILLEDVH